MPGVSTNMKLHPRTILAEEAKRQFNVFMLEWSMKHDLTYGEIIGIVAEYLTSKAKYLRREERHPDEPGKGGDEE